jgi:hypothetical protein
VDALEFNTTLAKLLQSLKKDCGAEKVQQNYRGTGKQNFRRQLYVRVPGGLIDLWLEHGMIRLGGCIGAGSGVVIYGEKTPAEVYAEVVPLMKAFCLNPHR